MQKPKFIIPSKPINEKETWQTFLDYHELRTEDVGIKDKYEDAGFYNQRDEWYWEWLGELKEKNLLFKPFEFMPISPNNSNFNH